MVARITVIIMFVMLFLQGCSVDIPENLELNNEIKELADGTKYIVHPSKIQSGGPPKDGIPSIDDPNFISMVEADEWIRDNELVMAIIYKNVKRVYPLQIMVWHEIVNDKIAGDAIVITYCPLCGSGIAYVGEIEGFPVEFGTTGKLYNSNLIMYDRKTETWWTQIDGRAIRGELTGKELQPISIDTVSWGEWKIVHPDSEVLSRDTGFSRSYGVDPYGSYYEDSFLMFPLENTDNRVHPKTIIFGIEVNGQYKAYKESDLVKADIMDVIENISILATRDESGIVKFINTETNQELVKERDFWFAWYAFHPETLLYGNN